MKNKILIFLVLFATELASCQNKFNNAKIKDDDFKKYVSLFKEGSLPFSTYDEMYCPENIEKSLIRKFICKEESCLKDWSGYEIEFGPCVQIPSNGDYVILIYDESTEGGTVRKLTTYDYHGKKIAELEIFAEKPFHGERQKNEIDHYEIESIISSDLRIEKKYFAIYAEEWKVDDTRYFYGRYIESVYKIETNGNIILISEKDHGKQKYVGGRLEPSFFPRWKVSQ